MIEHVCGVKCSNPAVHGTVAHSKLCRFNERRLTSHPASRKTRRSGKSSLFLHSVFGPLDLPQYHCDVVAVKASSIAVQGQTKTLRCPSHVVNRSLHHIRCRTSFVLLPHCDGFRRTRSRWVSHMVCRSERDRKACRALET